MIETVAKLESTWPSLAWKTKLSLPLYSAVGVYVQVTNAGARRGTEVVQLYVRDPVASVTRPVRELKAFRRVELEPGETRTVRFVLHASQLAFPGRNMRSVVEPGRIKVWVGGSSEASLGSEFELVEKTPPTEAESA